SLEKKTDKLKAGVAGAIAIGSLTQYTGSGTHHVAVGIGGYEGSSALAGGYTYAISAQTTIRGTVAYDSEGDFGFGASVGHSW
ncbi:MAG: YadA C-terminal domain-containing protein, partial [Clostridium sp.]